MTEKQPQCLEHTGICERIVGVENDVKEVKQKIDHFFWVLLATLLASVGSLIGMVVNLTLNKHTNEVISTMGKVLTP
jgi:hypothetical protein